MTNTKLDTGAFRVMVGGNGRVFKFIAGLLFTVCIFIAGLYVSALSQKIDTVKVDSTRERTKIESRVDTNTANIGQLKISMALIEYQTTEILRIIRKKDSL